MNPIALMKNNNNGTYTEWSAFNSVVGLEFPENVAITGAQAVEAPVITSNEYSLGQRVRCCRRLDAIG